ncbi:MAG: glycoside hydrolase family 9 protein [Firmicutes bacterium]|nr:glycoside hydrolase family 9 protein [Bacillota bacterium]
MKNKHLLALCVGIALVCITVIGPMMAVNAQAPAGWRNLPDFYVFKDSISGWSGSGNGELETVNSNLPVDTTVTYENLPSLRFNLQTKLSSWISVVICLAGWANHDVSRYVPNGYLEFNVKGKNGGEQFTIGAIDHVTERASGVEHTITVPVTNYCTVTTGWQHVKIPLKDILAPSLDMNAYEAKALTIGLVTSDPVCVWINQLKITSPDKENAFPAIKVNQLGFRVSSVKYAWVSGFEDDFSAVAGTQFQVKKVSDNSVVYSGQLVLVADYDANDSGERVFKAGFTGLKQPGDYYITVNASGIDKSPRFKIGDDVYKPLVADASRYFYYQRANIGLVSPYCGNFPRKDKTPGDFTASFKSNPASIRDVSKGWYDAGDSGKYVTTGAATLSNLFWAYELYPGAFFDNQNNIPESGNGVPDILDEARWELEWMLKMQDTGSGGFYTRVATADDGTTRLIRDTDGVTANIKPTNDTAYAAAALAHASIIYAKFDSAFAQTCLNSAKSAWAYLEQNPNNIKAPDTPYASDTDLAARFWAAAALYRATGEAKYNNYVTSNYTNAGSALDSMTGDEVWDWNTAFFCYMKANNRSSDVERWYRDKFTKWTNNKVDRYKSSPWGNIIINGNYYWGSNDVILNVPMEALAGSTILGTISEDIQNMAFSALNYILGANPMRKSMVSNEGDDSVKNVYSTFSEDGLAGVPNGFMAGGANKYQGAGLSIFAAKCYMDSTCEWTTNEHTIGWNSVLVFMSAFADSVSSPTPTPTSISTPTPTPTVRSTATPTLTRVATPTPTQRTATPTPTRRTRVTPTRRTTPTFRPSPTRALTPTPTRRAVNSTPTPTNSGSYLVAYVISSDWGSGATINVTITNKTTTTVNGWTLAFIFPGNQTITNLWNGTYTQSGASVLVKDAGYNANIPAGGGSTNFGFNIYYSGTNAKPTSFTLNGTACQVQ